MLTFLFWNLKQPRSEILASLARQHRVDVLMLAEWNQLAPHGIVLKALNERTAEYFPVPSDCAKVAIFTRFSDAYVIAQAHGDDYTIRRLALPGRPEILLSVAHLPSKRYYKSVDQTAISRRFSDSLAEAETAREHSRTIVVGDLNMNPYEDGVVSSDCLHAVPTREIAYKRVRRMKSQSNLYFYNPMWRHFGERPEGHAGTYYLSSPKVRADFWNIYDQVLVRPDLLPYFRDRELEIVHRDIGADVSFLKNGSPDKEVSDHLPILFRLHI